MSSCDISVIITARNEEKHIENCLKSIKGQDYHQDKIEIIAVDNNSNDKTKEIASSYTNKVYNYGPERSAQRNFGVKQAKGEYVLYLDSDMMLSRSVIKESVEKCEREGCIALYIPERIIGEGFWVKVRDFERSFYNATLIDCVRFIRKDNFLEIGGFDEGLTGPEDWDFDRRIKGAGKTGIINAPIYHNEGKFNLRRYINKKIYYARSFDAYIRKWGKNDPIVRKQLGFFYRYIEVFLNNGKWRRFVRHPLLAVGVYVIRIMLGTAYLKKLYAKNKKRCLDYSPYF